MMQRFIPRTLTGFVLLALVPSIAASETDLLFSFDEIIQEAAFVARVRLLDRRPVFIPGKSDPCSYQYRARVIEALKGTADEIVFSNETESDFVGFDRDYFVVVSRISEESRARARGSAPGIGEGLQCLVAAGGLFMASGGLFIMGDVQRMLAFDPTSAGNQSPGVRMSRGSVLSELGRFPEIQMGAVPWSRIRDEVAKVKGLGE